MHLVKIQGTKSQELQLMQSSTAILRALVSLSPLLRVFLVL